MQILDVMHPEDAKIYLQTSKFSEQLHNFKSLCKNESSQEIHERWFDFNFFTGNTEVGTLKSQNDEEIGNLHLPGVNPFLPSNFELFSDSGEFSNSKKPRRLPTMDPSFNLFYVHDKRFKLPKVNCFYRISSPSAYASPREAALAHLFMKLLEDSLCEQAYLADMAGLHYAICLDGSAGFDVRIEGFSDKIQELSRMIFTTFSDLSFTNENFGRIKEVVSRHYHNALMSPRKHAQFLRLQTLKNICWDPRTISSEIQVIQADDVRRFILKLSSKLHMLALVSGNITPQGATQMVEEAARLIGVCPDCKFLSSCVLNVPPGKGFIRKEKTVNLKEDNSNIEYYLQLGLGLNARDRCFLDMIDQLIYEPCYDILRTKEQLGYVVSSGPRLTDGVQGLCITIQSRTYSAQQLEERIEEFLRAFFDTLKTMSREEFEVHKQAVIDHKQTKDKNLAEEAERLWDELVNRAGEFDCREADIDALREVTKDQVISYYSERLHPDGTVRSKLVIHVDPPSRWNPTSLHPGALIDAEKLETLHDSQKFYPPISI